MAKRKRNLVKIKKFDDECVACGNWASEIDHIKCFKRQSMYDQEFNMWKLCSKCHREKGYSLNKFVEKYRLHRELESRGFYFDEFDNKWKNTKLTIQ